MKNHLKAALIFFASTVLHASHLSNQGAFEQLNQLRLEKINIEQQINLMVYPLLSSLSPEEAHAVLEPIYKTDYQLFLETIKNPNYLFPDFNTLPQLPTHLEQQLALNPRYVSLKNDSMLVYQKMKNLRPIIDFGKILYTQEIHETIFQTIALQKALDDQNPYKEFQKMIQQKLILETALSS